MYIVRRFEEREEWSSENVYLAYDAPPYEGDPYRAIVERFVRVHGPVSIYTITTATQFPLAQVAAVLDTLDVETISVGESREEMYLFKDEMDALRDAPSPSTGRYLYDPRCSAGLHRRPRGPVLPIIADGAR